MGFQSETPISARFSLVGAGRIPLRNRYGRVRAYATVDLADFADVGRHRWCMNGNGYVMRCIGGRRNKRAEFLHRRLMGLGSGKEDPRTVDHRDRDPLNNRRDNLRIASPAEQSQNVPGKTGKTSRFRGVSWCESKAVWLAQARCGTKRFTRHCHSEAEAAEAAAAWRAANMPFATS